MQRRHQYETSLTWTGNRGAGTADYGSYDRRYETDSQGRPTLQGSSDQAFRGDGEHWNPELLLVAALSQCHLLSYLHLCAVSGVTVSRYADAAVGTMIEDAAGGGHFAEVILRPVVSVTDPRMVTDAEQLHEAAAKLCFIASSVNFPVRHEPLISANAPL